MSCPPNIVLFRPHDGRFCFMEKSRNRPPSSLAGADPSLEESPSLQTRGVGQSGLVQVVLNGFRLRLRNDRRRRCLAGGDGQTLIYGNCDY